ncbi:AraC family ligand binding domain-containing protein [Capnocytophaga sp. ARDL2]|uniref:AraC family ligand binding domain-containing protein n=1 Tax=Capnocytophaga sp. ARDL2 TaxID=3238809 RepID=UPI0035586DC1
MKTVSIFKDLEFNETRPMISVLLETDFTKEIRIAMHKGTKMKEHKTAFPIVVHIVQGCISFGVQNQLLELNQGDIIALDPNVPHDLKAIENSVIRLTLTKNDTVDRVQTVVE